MFKVAGPMWAQATAGDTVLARLVKTGKKVLRRVLQKEIEPTAAREFPKPTWSLAGQAIKADCKGTSGRVIGGLFPKQVLKTQAAEARRQAALRLIRDARKVPVFAFVGLSLGASLDQKTESSDVLCSGIRDLFQQYGGKESVVTETGDSFSLETLELGQLIGQGCCAAVFEARPVGVAPASEVCDKGDNTGETHPETTADHGIQSETDSTPSGHDAPPSTFSTLPPPISHTHDDFDVISDEESNESDGQLNMDGWVLYRLTSGPASPAPDFSAPDDSDTDSDIFILARDQESLDSTPDTSNAGSDTDTSNAGSESAECASVDDERDFPLAVKMMFNYSTQSSAPDIMAAMQRETVPATHSLSQSGESGLVTLPPHPNIVTMHGVFVDSTPDLPAGREHFPSALPPRLNQDGCGRNSTMFLVMKKYSTTLDQYLSVHQVSTDTRCLLLAQLLEGVAHLGLHSVAHRDLKANNILIDLSHGADSPRLAISDFGSCLADAHYRLRLPYPTTHTDKGGNSALMAPEIKCARPGPDSVLDYSKADVWAVGALAYEILGATNPFYDRLDSATYCHNQLPSLPGETPEGVVRLVTCMLHRDPAQRPSASVAATAIQLCLWAPSHMHPLTNQLPQHYNPLWRCKELYHWLEQVTMETVCQRVFEEGKATLDVDVKSAFLSRVSQRDIFALVAYAEGCE